MLKDELREILRNGESSGVEFKLDLLEPRKLAKELVALANLHGGIVLLGVDDDGQVCGLTRSDLEEWVMNVARDKIRPELIPYFEIIRDIEPGKDIAVVRVDRGWTVHHLWHDRHRTYYIRVGSTSREASKEELERLFQQRGAFRAELRPVSGSGFDDLDRRRLEDYFVRVRKQEIPRAEDRAAWIRLLVNVEILSDEGATCPSTMAGLLLFGRTPNRFLPQAGLTVAAFSGAEKDYATVEGPLSLRGPLTPLASVDATGRLAQLEPGVVEQALDFVRRNTRVVAEIQATGQRVQQREYPEEAVREAVVNALIHRDYLLGATDVELSLYDDRLEVISPGELPNGITPERMRAGCRAARNELLKEVMRDYGYLEHMGLGIPRKIIRLMREQNGTEPDLVEGGERFLVRLWKRRGGATP